MGEGWCWTGLGLLVVHCEEWYVSKVLSSEDRDEPDLRAFLA
jgi:hypothetical protein